MTEKHLRRQPRFTGVSIWLILLSTLLATSQPVVAETTNDDLPAQVEQLMELCQGGEALPAEQLTGILARCDALLAELDQSDLPQKKLLMIRLKKSRGLCNYLLQLKSEEKREK